MSNDRAFGKLPVFFSLFVVERHANSVSNLGEFGRDFALDSSENERVTCLRRSLSVSSGFSTKSLSKSLRLPSKPGMRNLKMVQRSRAVFSIGVRKSKPVTGVYGKTGLGNFGFGFLIS